jgi:hypothetical protein
MQAPLQPLVYRVLARLTAAEAEELNPWLRDDLRIARLTVLHAARGEAVLCSPQVLASYEVLGLHPEKVWPAIEARRLALTGPEIACALKKPPQSVKLWFENTSGARAVNSAPRLQQGSPRTTISVPMAAPSIAALYPNSDAPSSAKSRSFTYSELLTIVRKSWAPASVVAGTVNAITARGRWPESDGPVHGIICVSLDGMMLGGPDGDRNCVRSTARWRARRAVKLGYWRELRKANSWSNCRKCGAERATGKCEQCGYVGRAKTPEGKPNFDEFCRPYMYEINIEKFRHAPQPKGIRHFDARAYQEHKSAAARGEHPNVTEIRKPAQPTPPPPPPAPAAPLPERAKPAAQQAQHRDTSRQLRQLTSRERANLVQMMTQLMRGHTRHTERQGGYGYDLGPDDPRYVAPLDQESALRAACKKLLIPIESAIEALKLAGFKVEPDAGSSS